MRNVPKVKSIPTKLEIRPPKQNVRVVTRPKGPQLYQQPAKPNVQGGPGEPPPGFLDPALHGSRSEWPIYWSLWRYFDTSPRDGVRKPPFIGEPGIWAYQSWQLGGRSQALGAVADFEIFSGRKGQSLLIRIQSDRFHLTAPPSIRATDDLQLQRLQQDNRVVDIYENDFLHLYGKELVTYIADVLSGTQIISPVTSGTYRRSS